MGGRTLGAPRLGRVAVAFAAAAAALALLPASPAAVLGTKPWVVVLCNFTNQDEEPHPVSYFERLFSDAGSGQLGVLDYWSDVSYGELSVSGTVVKGWYTLGDRDEWGTLSRYEKIQVCADEAADDVDYGEYHGVAVVFPHAQTTVPSALDATQTTITVESTDLFPTPPFRAAIDNGPSLANSEIVNVTEINGTTLTVERGVDEDEPAIAHDAGSRFRVPGDLGGFGPTGITLGGEDFTLGLVIVPHLTNVMTAAHELGHGFGYDHSRRLGTSTQDYNDCWDLMSALTCVYHFEGTFGESVFGSKAAAAGPGLNAILLEQQGWLPLDRQFTFDDGRCPSVATRRLAALNHPSAPGDLVVKVPAAVEIPNGAETTTTSDYYTLEFRHQSGWDRAIPSHAVVLHLHGLDGRSYLVDEAGATGGLAAGDEYVDSANRAYLAVNRIDAAARMATVTVGECKIVTDTAYVGDRSADFGDEATLAADVTVFGTGAPIPKVPVDFRLGGSPQCTAETDENGRASCTVSIDRSTGPHTVAASFTGDDAYNASSSGVEFRVTAEDTRLTYTGDLEADFGDRASLSARLVEEDGVPLAGQTVAFALAGETCSGETDAAGVASCSLAVTEHPGTSPLTATFEGSLRYGPSKAESPFLVTREGTRVTYTGVLTGDYHDPATVAATVVEEDGAPLAGQTVVFTLAGGDTCSAATDAAGRASCELTPSRPAGMYELGAAFAGDPDYVGSSDSVPFEVTREQTEVVYTGPLVIDEGGGVTLSARLLEEGTVPIEGRTLVLRLGTQECAGPTGPGGAAACTIDDVAVPLGPQSVTASFAGDAFYRESADAGEAIVFAFPSTGAFVLGDRTVAAATPATSVDWWAEKWSSLNLLGGGRAPAAFKGFAATPNPAPPRCGATFTTRSGGSSSPPATVPAYMGTIVAQSVSRAGSAIFGNVVGIVVVATAPGYAPDPSSPGRGTIVATYC